MKVIKIGSLSVLFAREYKDKYFVPMQMFEPFILMLDAVINIVLLPFPLQCCIHGTYLRTLIKAQCQKRLKNLEKYKGVVTPPFA